MLILFQKYYNLKINIYLNECTQAAAARLRRKASFSLLLDSGAFDEGGGSPSLLPSLAVLSQQDYEVNAPAGQGGLLNGQELLTALGAGSYE